jgi:hypothetical protein|tara:strand:+ start:664 stop:999 length:336 start_codon:yes stop_codon:yes gene_type:complete
MKISFKKGKKTEGDKIILIEANKESISMMDLASMVNQFALNELIIIDESWQFSRDKHFWYANLMERAIEDAKNNVDWITCEKEKLKDLTGRPFFIKTNMLNKFLEERKVED